jgi:hypothetical protein
VTGDGAAKLEFVDRRPGHPEKGMSFIAFEEPETSTPSEINRKRYGCLA